MATVSAKRSGDGVDIHIAGGPKIDEKVVASCIQEVLNCGCLNDGVHFTAKCLDVVRRHEESTHCVSKCFGCS